MHLYKEILSKEIGRLALRSCKNIDHAKIVKLRSLRALQKIKAIVHDDSLSDFECVERIVRVLEDIGSGGGGRHDF